MLDASRLAAVHPDAKEVVAPLARRAPPERESPSSLHRSGERGRSVVSDGAGTGRTVAIHEPGTVALREEREVPRRADRVHERVDVHLPVRVELHHARLAPVRRFDLHAILRLGEPSCERVSRHRRLGQGRILRPELEGRARHVEVAPAGVELDLHVDVDHLAVHDKDAAVELREGKDVHAGLALEHVIVHVLEGDRLARRGGEGHLRDLVRRDDEPHEEVAGRSLRLRGHDEPERPDVGRDVDPRDCAVGEVDDARGLAAGFAVLRFA